MVTSPTFANAASEKPSTMPMATSEKPLSSSTGSSMPVRMTCFGMSQSVPLKLRTAGEADTSLVSETRTETITVSTGSASRTTVTVSARPASETRDPFSV